jgi:predicted Zn-dependent peptidase
MNRTVSPTLETTHLLLRPMLASDVEQFLTLFGDRQFIAAFDAEPFDREQMTGRPLYHIVRTGE